VNRQEQIAAALPIYTVRMPSGEIREMDPASVCAAYFRREIHFSTLVRGKGDTEFHRLDADPGFIPLLGRLYGRVRSEQIISPLLIVLLILPILVLPFFCDFFSARFLGYILAPAVLIMLIRIIRQFGFLPLPDGLTGIERVIGQVLRTLFFGAGLLFFVWMAFGPLDGSFPETAAGKLLFVHEGSFLLFLLLTLPSRLAAYRTWKKENPRPRETRPWYQLSRSSAPAFPQAPIPARRMLTTWLGLIAVPLGYWGMFYLGANVQWESAQLHRDFPVFQVAEQVEPPPLPAIAEVPQDIFDWFRGRTGEPTGAREKIRQVLPQLDAFRTMLKREAAKWRRLPRERICFSTVQSEAESKNCYSKYLTWRRIEAMAAAPDAVTARYFALLDDLTDLSEIYRLGRDNDRWTVHFALSARLKVLEKVLRKLPDSRLHSEMVFWKEAGAVTPVISAGIFLDTSRKFIPYDVFPVLFLPLWRGCEADVFREWHRARAELAGKRPTRPITKDRFPMMTEHDVWLVRQRAALCRLALTALELESYRRKHGGYPAGPRLPQDPFSGNPLKYEPAKRIYSVGDDYLGRKKGFQIVFRLDP